MAQQGDHYTLDEQGLWVEKVGPWATDKLKIVTDYIQASSAARRQYLGTGAAFIDVILLSRHELAHELWSKISSAAKAPKFDF